MKRWSEEPRTSGSSLKLFGRFESERMRWAGHVACVGVEEKCSQGIAMEHEGERRLGRFMFRWGE
jgi:hypothetical protein